MNKTVLVIIVFVALIVNTVMFAVLMGVFGREHIVWENGVFYGAVATRSGSTSESVLEDAYEMKQTARESVEAQEKRLKELRKEMF